MLHELQGGERAFLEIFAHSSPQSVLAAHHPRFGDNLQQYVPE